MMIVLNHKKYGRGHGPVDTAEQQTVAMELIAEGYSIYERQAKEGSKEILLAGRVGATKMVADKDYVALLPIAGG